LSALLETEWVQGRRYGIDKPSIAGAFRQALEGAEVEFEHPPMVEEALYVWARRPRAAFADCLLAARAAHPGCSRCVTFEVGAAQLSNSCRAVAASGAAALTEQPD